jgi:putative transposase
MVLRLQRLHEERELHFVTFSCWHRLGYLAEPAARDLFEDALEGMQARYCFAVLGYVVMPEHVHLLLSEPAKALLSAALQALKLSVAKRSQQRPFWQARYYDFNVCTQKKRVEKLNYIHWNPMKRGLVKKPEDWRWSSCHYYQTGVKGRVTIADNWEWPAEP